MIITQTIQMDLDRMGIAPCIEAVQGDTDSRAVELTLCSGSAPWPIPEGVTGRIRFQKPDGTGGVYDTMPDGTEAVHFQENRITTALVPQMLTKDGIVFVQVEMILAGKSLATFPFRVAVREDLCASTLDSEDYINLSAFVTEQVRQAVDAGELETLADQVDMLQGQVQLLDQEVADLKYVKIDVTSVSVSPSTAEMGSTVNTVTVTWAINKTPVSQTVNGQPVAANLRTQTLNNQALTGTKAYTVAATDERNATDSALASVTFLNGVYYGVMDKNAQFKSPSEAILSLTRKLQSSRGATFTVNAGADEQIMFALPVRYGTPVFTVGGFEGGFSFMTNVDFTNGSGYTEQYALWLSDNFGLGSTTVKVT